MADPRTSKPKLVDLVEALIADIQHRRLQPGDRYLSAVDATKLLGVSSGTANRALQVLERRQIITRQQRRGAYIATLPSAEALLLRRVHFLVHENYLTSEGVGNDFVLMGMQEQLPGVDVRISFLPKDNAGQFVQKLIDQSLAEKARDGFVLVRAPHEVHQVISDSGMPAIVYGCPYPGIPHLNRVDRDMVAIGTLAARYLLSRGHRCIAWLGRQQSLPGDHETLDAASDVLAEHGLSSSSLIFRAVPSSNVVAMEMIEQLLDLDEPPTGFLCRSQRSADAVAAVLKKRNEKLYSGCDVVLCDYYLLSGHRPQFVFPRPVHSSEVQGRYMARNLDALARGEKVDDVIIPVELDESAARAVA